MCQESPFYTVNLVKRWNKQCNETEGLQLTALCHRQERLRERGGFQYWIDVGQGIFFARTTFLFSGIKMEEVVEINQRHWAF